MRSQIPNGLSLSRLVLSSLFVVIFSETDPVLFILALSFALMALLTDFLDGYLARRWNAASELGYFLDGMGDKAFTAAICLVMMTTHAELAIVGWLLIVREIFLYALRAIDNNKQANLKKLRKLSLLQAGTIRLYFLVYFSSITLLFFDLNLHPFDMGLMLLFGCISAISGWLSIAYLTNSVFKEELSKP